MTKKELLKAELEKCNNLWSRFSCDCLHYYMEALENEIKKCVESPERSGTT